MSGIQDFIGMASQKLGISPSAAREGTGGLLSMVRQQVGEADFGKLSTAIPGVSDLAAPKPAGGLGGALGGLASKAGGLLGKSGGAAGALAALAGAGLTGDKATGFLSLFADFVKTKVSPDLLKSLASKVNGLSGLLG